MTYLHIQVMAESWLLHLCELAFTILCIYRSIRERKARMIRRWWKDAYGKGIATALFSCSFTPVWEALYSSRSINSYYFPSLVKMLCHEDRRWHNCAIPLAKRPAFTGGADILSYWISLTAHYKWLGMQMKCPTRKNFFWYSILTIQKRKLYCCC